MAIEMKVSGNKLIIEVDVSPKALASAPPSKSGKTRTVATTGGFGKVDGHDKIKVNLTVATPPKIED